MRKLRYRELFESFLDIKERQGLEIVDTHIHPRDVLGIVSDLELAGRKSRPLTPSLLERLEYNSAALKILESIFYFAPGYIRRNISSVFKDADERKLLDEMRNAGVDRGTLVPVAPFVSARQISKDYSSNKFIRLGSVDVRAVPVDEIKRNIEEQITRFHIVGLKLHPNLQRFFPQPSGNAPEIAEKLKKIYEIAEARKLYLLFHGGVSYLLHTERQKYDYALLKNFCKDDGTSEIFNYRIPIIIAHLGVYNVIRPELSLLVSIARKYRNVFFDTSGVSPQLISKVITLIGADRIIFGSDALYFRIKFNLELVFKAIALSETEESLEEKIAMIFSRNYTEKILNFRF